MKSAPFGTIGILSVGNLLKDYLVGYQFHEDKTSNFALNMRTLHSDHYLWEPGDKWNLNWELPDSDLRVSIYAEEWT